MNFPKYFPLAHSDTPALRRWPRCAAWLILLVSLCACQPESRRADVVVSIEPLRYFAEQIAGDRLTVTSIVPPHTSPEAFEPTPQDMRMVADAMVYFKVGNLGFETTWLEYVAQNVPNAPIYSVADSVALIRTLGALDPHIWMSPRNARPICQAICQDLCRLDTAGAALYKANLQRFLNRIDSLEATLHSQLSNIEARTFVIAHPALTYFAADYGLTQLSIEAEGKEPGVADMETLVRQGRQHGVRVILVQAEFNSDMVQTLARETGATIHIVNPLSYDWEGELLTIANILCHAELSTH